MCIINGKFWTYLVFYETWVNRPCLICKQKIVTFFKYSLCNALNVVLYHEFGPGYLQDGLGRRDVWFTSALALRVGSQLDFSMWTELNASGFRWRMSASLLYFVAVLYAWASAHYGGIHMYLPCDDISTNWLQTGHGFERSELRVCYAICAGTPTANASSIIWLIINIMLSILFDAFSM